MNSDYPLGTLRDRITEITIFKIKSDINEADFLQADAEFTEELRKIGGFIERELLKGDNRQWVDIIHWQSLEDAIRSANTIANKPGAQKFIQMLDGDDSSMFHLTSVHSYR